MNDQQFEQELRSLAPRPATARLAAAIEAQLAAPPRALRSRLRWAAIAFAAAACLAVSYVILRPAPESHAPVAPRLASSPSHLATLAMYQRALGESPEAVDTLLRRDDRIVAFARPFTSAPPSDRRAYPVPLDGSLFAPAGRFLQE